MGRREIARHFPSEVRPTDEQGGILTMRHSDFEMCLMRYLELTQDHDNRDGE